LLRRKEKAERRRGNGHSRKAQDSNPKCQQTPIGRIPTIDVEGKEAEADAEEEAALANCQFSHAHVADTGAPIHGKDRAIYAKSLAREGKQLKAGTR
jgi:hypothetical protein